MESIKELYRIGVGPSSSHTMGPRNAAEIYLSRHPDAASYRVTLFGSLAATGKGHLTDATLYEAFQDKKMELVWQPEVQLPLHPNGMRFEVLSEGGEAHDEWDVYSVGGGALMDRDSVGRRGEVYPLTTLTEIIARCEKTGQAYWAYVEECEGPEIWDFLGQVWQVMRNAIARGIDTEGVLPGGLGLARKAWSMYKKTIMGGEVFKRSGYLSAYALAVSEENAAGGTIVTAPTCGSCGVIPGVLRYLQEQMNSPEKEILRALATAGLIGNLVKHNASISGAEVGCQGEIGTACAMASAAATQLYGGTIRQIEYAAEMGLEHHLGLTCDPVAGLVQIPCIERNAFAATRAVACADYSIASDGTHHVPFDEVVTVMRQTGHDLPSLYRETSFGGLAEAFRRRVPGVKP